MVWLETYDKIEKWIMRDTIPERPTAEDAAMLRLVVAELDRAIAIAEGFGLERTLHWLELAKTEAHRLLRETPSCAEH